MGFRYLEDIATADAAFEAWGNTLEELFAASADATINVMVSDLSSIAINETRFLSLSADAPDMLLFELLQELIYFKDAEGLLLRVTGLDIQHREDGWHLQGTVSGEKIDSSKHDLVVDVKAVTFHRFRVEKTQKGWEAVVILDI